MALVTKGTSCIETAKKTYNIIVSNSKKNSRVKQAITHLKSLSSDGIALVDFCTKKKEELEHKETELHETMSAYQANKQELEGKKMSLKERKTELDTAKGKLEVGLKNAKADKERAEGELHEAEHKLRKAKKKGGILEKVKKVIGIKDGHVKSAKSRLHSRQHAFKEATKSVMAEEESLKHVDDDLIILQGEIDGCVKSIQELHNQIGVLKESIVFAINAIHVWELFTMACENATERTGCLRKIVDIVDEKKEYKILESDGTIIVANTFLDAWEALTGHYQALHAIGSD